MTSFLGVRDPDCCKILGPILARVGPHRGVALPKDRSAEGPDEGMSCNGFWLANAPQCPAAHLPEGRASARDRVQASCYQMALPLRLDLLDDQPERPHLFSVIVLA